MTAGQRSKQEWVAGLAELEPDLVIDTGDNLAGLDAVPGTLRALDPLLDRPGAFVMASNDYYAPRPKNPLKYFWPDHKRVHGDQLPWRDLRDGMLDRGWLDLTNAAGELTVGGRRIVFAGVDDSHLKRDRYDQVAGPADRVRRRPDRPGALPRAAGARPVRRRRLRPAALRAHPRRPAAGAVLRGAGHQLRHRPGAGPLAAPLGRADAGRARPAPGCTSRPAWAPARTRRCASPARRRRRCSR